MKMCLGTVQFGMKYGINNTLGQPSKEQVFEMLDAAIDNGIDVIDTARAYGDAEILLGEYFSEYNKEAVKHVSIISKLRPNSVEVGDNACDTVFSECESSLKRLCVDKLDGYLLHTPEYIYREDILDALIKLRDRGYVKNIGVSIYGIPEGDAAISAGVVDYIQLPYSVLDQRGTKTGFLKRAKEAGITIFTRSAFLQGLFMMDHNRIPDHLQNAVTYLDEFEEIISKYGVDRVTALLHFVKNVDDIDYLVWGVDTKEQLLDDIKCFHENVVPKEMLDDIRVKIDRVDESIIIPSLWSGGRKAE